MKATGIVRRIDDLGRIVIPKEIRRTMRIREGDPLEIYTNHDGEVIFKKYSVLEEISSNASQVAEIISRLAGCPVIIFDRDNIVAVSGVPKKEYLGRRATSQIEEIMIERKRFFSDSEENSFEPVEGIDRKMIGCVPVLSNGDVTGAVVFLADDNFIITDMQKSLLLAAGQFLGKQTEY
jgi:AbrB family transcriptional regulator (stage V sporulation protein T)